MFLKISEYSQKNTSLRQSLIIASLLVKLLGGKSAKSLKKNSNACVSCEICEIFKNIFFHKTPPVATSVIFK